MCTKINNNNNWLPVTLERVPLFLTLYCFYCFSWYFTNSNFQISIHKKQVNHLFVKNLSKSVCCFIFIHSHVLLILKISLNFIFTFSRWEHPDASAIKRIVDRPAQCTLDISDTPGLSTLHHYFYNWPWFTFCSILWKGQREVQLFHQEKGTY